MKDEKELRIKKKLILRGPVMCCRPLARRNNCKKAIFAREEASVRTRMTG